MWACFLLEGLLGGRGLVASSVLEEGEDWDGVGMFISFVWGGLGGEGWVDGCFDRQRDRDRGRERER